MKSVISIEALPVLFEATSSPVVEEEVAVTWIVPTALGVQVVDTLGLAAAAMGESMLLFAFASVALEFAFQREWVKPFKN